MGHPKPEHDSKPPESHWSLRPARDLGMAPLDRNKSVKRETGIFGYAIRNVWWLGVGTFLKLWNRFQVIGQENIPAQLPFVLVANHSSHLDVIALTLAVPLAERGNIFALAAEDHFFRKVGSTLFASTLINALPMSRSGDGKGREDIQMFRERLLQDRLGIIVFPEGTRSRDGTMGRFRSGIGNLVGGTSILVVPCYIDGAHQAFPPDRKVIRRKPVTIRIGAPLSFATLSPSKEGCAEIAARLEERVRALRV